MKRVLICSDLHCGHRAGLTPPSWQYATGGGADRDKFAKLQKCIWEWWVAKCAELKKIDVLICNGDAIDGKGDRSGGTEQLEEDMIKQAEMAAECLSVPGAKKIYMTYGTPYHTGKSEDFEYLVAEKLGAEIHSHAFIDVNGLIFDVKHKTSSSIIPHGRHTGISRDALWNVLWSTQEEIQPNAHVTVRSHVHYFASSEAWGKLNIITPAMMGFGSKYGARQCSGIVNIGFVTFEIEDSERFSWDKHILRSEFLADNILTA
jgi:hypothetical protein